MSLVSESLNKNMTFMDSPNFTFVTYKSIIGLPIIRNSHSKKIMHFLALDLEYGLMQIWDGSVGPRDKKCLYKVAIKLLHFLNFKRYTAKCIFLH